MRVFKVYNATTDGWLDWPERTFYAHAVYGTSFSTYEDAEGCAAVMDARWEGHRIQIVEIDVNTWSEREEEEAELYDLAKSEDLDTYGYQV